MAVIATSVVGLAGVLTPAITRAQDRRHEQSMMIRQQRADAYAQVLMMLHHVREMDEPRAIETAQTSSVVTWLWGSPEVRDLLNTWLHLNPATRGPLATDADREQSRLAAEALSLRMADEVQGRVPLH